MRDADRLGPLLRQARVIDDELGVAASQHRVELLAQHLLYRCGVPGRCGNEVMDLLNVLGRDSRADRLHALALAGQQQTENVERRPRSATLVTKHVEKRTDLAIEPLRPCRRVLHHSPLNRTAPDGKKTMAK